MKMPIRELVEQVKEELLCYEDAAGIALRWETEFFQWTKAHQGRHKDLMTVGGKPYFQIRDEEEIFEIADAYMDALEEDRVKQYWEKF